MLIDLVIVIVVVGVILWGINRFIPMEPNTKSLLNLVVIVVLAIYAVKALGLLDALNIPLR